ncbi:MAG TPA: hypothetical protein VGE52_05670, partial [Pirellulales bacterium]
MSDASTLLDLIEAGIAEHGGDLGGWTRRDDDFLQVFDGRVTLRAEIRDESTRPNLSVVHAHVAAELHDHDDEVLDACLMGFAERPEDALAQVAGLWMLCVAGPIRSFLDDRPVCETSRVGVLDGDPAEGDTPHDLGLPGLRAYAGPVVSRGGDFEPAAAALADVQPWFRYAAPAASPRRVHLAKVTLMAHGAAGWERRLEVDGDDVAHLDPLWSPGVNGPAVGYATRFAVFEFPLNSREMARRAELDRTIRRFAERLAECESPHSAVDRLIEDMIREGFDADLVCEAESFAMLAFGRELFESHGVSYPATVIRARRDGRIETDVPLLSIPAFCRGRVAAAQMRETLSDDAFQTLGLYSAESHALMRATTNAGGPADLPKVKLYPSVVPERGASDETIRAAIKILDDLVGVAPPRP